MEHEVEKTFREKIEALERHGNIRERWNEEATWMRVAAQTSTGIPKKRILMRMAVSIAIVAVMTIGLPVWKPWDELPEEKKGVNYTVMMQPPSLECIQAYEMAQKMEDCDEPAMAMPDRQFATYHHKPHQQTTLVDHEQALKENDGPNSVFIGNELIGQNPKQINKPNRQSHYINQDVIAKLANNKPEKKVAKKTIIVFDKPLSQQSDAPLVAHTPDRKLKVKVYRKARKQLNNKPGKKGVILFARKKNRE